MKGKRLKMAHDSDGEEFLDESFDDMGVNVAEDRSYLISKVKKFVKKSINY